MGRILAFILLSSFLQTFAEAAPPRYRLAPERVEYYQGNEIVGASYGGRKVFYSGTTLPKTDFEFGGQRYNLQAITGPGTSSRSLDDRFLLVRRGSALKNEYLDGFELKKLDHILLPNGALEPRSLYKAQNGWLLGMTGHTSLNPRALA